MVSVRLLWSRLSPALRQMQLGLMGPLVFKSWEALTFGERQQVALAVQS